MYLQSKWMQKLVCFKLERKCGAGRSLSHKQRINNRSVNSRHEVQKRAGQVEKTLQRALHAAVEKDCLMTQFTNPPFSWSVSCEGNRQRAVKQWLYAIYSEYRRSFPFSAKSFGELETIKSSRKAVKRCSQLCAQLIWPLDICLGLQQHVKRIFFRTSQDVTFDVIPPQPPNHNEKKIFTCFYHYFGAQSKSNQLT